MKSYKAAGYLRLSNEDGDKIESDSILSQKQIVKNFVENCDDIELIGFYVDDGYTGTNFQRPQFRKMIEDLESGKCNCVVVKDLSRFGRDYIGVGSYLEKYFPLNDIRFISINDGYDTCNSNESDEFMVPIKNLFNAQYSKDISKKVKSAFNAKRQKGEFVGAFAGYGYKKDPKDKHKLVIDEAAAIVVRRIFSMYISGMGKIAIAGVLNQEGIPCPTEYKKLQGLNYRNANRLEYTHYWTYSTIHRILQNEMYIGNMVQGRNVRKTVRGKAKKQNESDWITINGTHEAIIDESVWMTTQELLKRRTRQLNFDSQIGLFSGFIFCGDCQRAFAKIRRRGKIYYVCGSYKRYSKVICSSHEVCEDLLETLILKKINEELKKIDESEIPDVSTSKIKVDKTPYQIRLEKLYRMKRALYEDYKEGVLNKDEYFSFKEDYQKEETMIQGQLNAINQEMEADSEKNEWIDHLKAYRRLDKLDRETLACILDSIVVYENEDEKRIEIKLKYSL